MSTASSAPPPEKSGAASPASTETGGVIVTFYSYKGGVGRSMAMINVAEVLADAGYQVIVCDWDLEAPGLERYLFDDVTAAHACWKHPGVVDLINEYKAMLAQPAGEAVSSDPSFAAVGHLRLRRPSSYAVPIPNERRQSGGSVRFLSAGRRDEEWHRKYTESVRDFDWPEFYNTWAGDAYFDFFRSDLAGAADFILIDSRTGVTELGGVCTHYLADVVVLCSAANDLNIDGTRWMAEVLHSPAQQQSRGERGPIAIVPVASRIEQTSETDLLIEFRKRFVAEFSRFLPPIFGQREGFLAATEIPYIPKYSLKEMVVARLRPEDRLLQLYSAYQSIAQGLIEWGVSSRRLRPPAQIPPAGTRTLQNANRPPAHVPKGRFFIAYGQHNATTANALAEGLRSAGLEVSCPPNLSSGPAEEPLSVKVQRAFDESSGSLILARPEDSAAWLECELNVALARRAVNPDYRALILLQGEMTAPAVVALLSRFTALRLPATMDAGVCNQILAELLPAQLRVSEDGAVSLNGVDIESAAYARYFFGREAEVRSLAQQGGRCLAQGCVCLVVSGPDGSGKTALIQAGLVPVILRGWGHERRLDPRLVSFRPGNKALASLAQALAPLLTPLLAPELERQLAASPTALAELVERNFTADAPLVLILDAAQELFAETEGAAAPGAQVLQMLDEAMQRSPGKLLLVVGIRSDALGQLQSSPLRRHLTAADALYRMPPLTDAGFRSWLAGAAHFAGATYEPGLEERLVADFTAEKAFAANAVLVLRQLWAKRQNRLLTHAAYVQLGGLGGILAHQAAGVLASLTPDQQAAAEIILTNLIDVRANERRFVPRAEVLTAARPLAHGQEVFQLLRQARLLMVGEDGRVGLAHDALLRVDIVRQWMAKNTAHLKHRDELEEAAKVWAQAGHPARLLPSPRETSRFVDLQGKTQLAEEYLGAAQRRERRTRQMAWGLGVAIVLALGALAFFGLQAQSNFTHSTSSLTNAIQDRFKLNARVQELEASLRKVENVTNASFAGLSASNRFLLLEIANLNTQMVLTKSNAAALNDKLLKAELAGAQSTGRLEQFNVAYSNALEKINASQAGIEKLRVDKRDLEERFRNNTNAVADLARDLEKLFGFQQQVEQEVLKTKRLDPRTVRQWQQLNDDVTTRMSKLEGAPFLRRPQGFNPTQEKK